MKIQLDAAAVEQAIKQYVHEYINNNVSVEEIDIVAGRGSKGSSATVTLNPMPLPLTGVKSSHANAEAPVVAEEVEETMTPAEKSLFAKPQ